MPKVWTAAENIKVIEGLMKHLDEHPDKLEDLKRAYDELGKEKLGDKIAEKILERHTEKLGEFGIYSVEDFKEEAKAFKDDKDVVAAREELIDFIKSS
jgi:hypothetical protein